MSGKRALSSAECGLILDFLCSALERASHLDPYGAQLRATYFLWRIMVLDGDVLRQISELCQQADYWDDEWQDAASKVRHTIACYLASAPGWRAAHQAAEDRRSLFSPSGEEPAAADTSGHAEIRMNAFSRLRCLDAWLAGGRDLAEFLQLWEPPDPNS
jgi:hypothetical protein